MPSSAGRLGAALLTAVLLAACGDDGQPTPTPPPTPAQPPSTQAAASPAVTTSTGPPPLAAVEVNDLARLCGAKEHRAVPSRPHAGPGPHPVAAFSKDGDQKEYTREYLVNRDGPEFDPQEPADVALLACITGAKTNQRVGTCRYKTDSGTRSVRVYAQRFTIDIFALDTGTRVARKTFLADFCPPGLVTLDGGADIPKQMYSTMTIDDRAKTLDPFVKRAA